MLHLLTSVIDNDGRNKQQFIATIMVLYSIVHVKRLKYKICLNQSIENALIETRNRFDKNTAAIPGPAVWI